MNNRKNEFPNIQQFNPVFISAEASLIVCFISLTTLGIVDQLLSTRWGNPLIDSTSRWFDFIIQIGQFSRIAILVIFIMMIINFVFKISQGVNFDFFISKNQFLLWLPIVFGWFVASILGAVRGTNLDSSLSAISMLAISVIYIQKNADYSTAILIFSRIMLLLFAISGFIFQEKAFAPYELTAGGLFPGNPRFTSFLQHPNTLAFSLVFLIFIELYLGNKFRIFFIPLAILLLLLTGSRSSMAIMVLGVVVAYVSQIIKFRKSKQKKSKSFIVLTTAAVIAIFLLFLVGVIQNGLNGRLATWEKAIQVIEKYPVFGSGPAAIFPEINIRNSDFVPYAHNQVLHTQAEQGIIGSVSLCLFIFIFIMMVIKTNFNSLLVASFTATLISFTTENVIRFAEPSFNFQLIVISAAILAALSQQAKRKEIILFPFSRALE